MVKVCSPPRARVYHWGLTSDKRTQKKQNNALLRQLDLSSLHAHEECMSGVGGHGIPYMRRVRPAALPKLHGLFAAGAGVDARYHKLPPRRPFGAWWKKGRQAALVSQGEREGGCVFAKHT